MLDAQNAASLPHRFLGPTRGPKGPLNQKLLFLYMYAKTLKMRSISLYEITSGIDAAAARHSVRVTILHHYFYPARLD
jgi:hypothetical protein